MELTTTGMKVYAFNTPPGYKLPQGPMFAPPQFLIGGVAEYGVDGRLMKQAFRSVGKPLEDGLLFHWDEYLDPVPASAKELSFKIVRLGEGTEPGDLRFEGPWEFKIPLQ